MMCLKVEEIIYIHQKLIERTGGSSEIRDMALLESAVYSMDAAYDGVELYPSIPEKAARLAYGLISNHAFVDGNKRIGVMAMLLTLRLNHVRLQYTQAELIALGLETASGQLHTEDIVHWIATHTVVTADGGKDIPSIPSP